MPTRFRVSAETKSALGPSQVFACTLVLTLMASEFKNEAGRERLMREGTP